MAATPSSPAAPSSSIDNCPICWDELSTTCGRTLVTLQCSHKFHLDCIGSTFNSFGEMRCPLCRAIESGTWILPRGREDLAASEDYDSHTDEDEFQFDEWDLFVVPAGLMDPTRALLYRPYSQPTWNQPPQLSFNSIFNHFADGNQTTSVASSIPRTQGVVDIEPFLEPVILEPGRSNGPTHCNFNWTCPPNNSPSPGVRAMMSGRSGSNGLLERVPTVNATLQSEQTQFNVPPNAPVGRQHQELPSIVQPETDTVSPSENFLDNIDPSSKL